MSETRQIRILCVEDEQDIRENISDILRDEGFEVFEAGNGKEGFESFLQNNPDIIISDIMMPELDGYGLLKLVRENKTAHASSVPFIFLSALGQKDDIIKGVNLSANDYLIKPIDFDLMIAKVREKAANYIKLQESHNRNMQNLKSQVAMVLPTDLFSYLDIITNISSTLKQEPFGPLPHRRYLEELDKIYINAMKLRSSINNALDGNTIDQRLNANEEIISLFNFLSELVASLSDKFKSRINLETPFDVETMSKIKIDRGIFVDAMRKILAGMFKFDEKANLKISIMTDHLDQMVIIFYVDSTKKEGMEQALDVPQIAKILDRQNCRFEVVHGRENTAVLVIPSHRLV
jgi:CheY-like chemotaxis protein